MSRIQGGRWVDISASHNGGFSIQASTGFRRLAEMMPDAARQTPRLWAFMGSIQKDACLRAIFRQNAFGRASPGTAIRVRGDMESWHCESPIFFTDSNPWNTSPIESKPTKHSLSYSVQWKAVSASEIAHGLHAQVLFSLTDIVCIFVEDLSEETDVASIIADHGSGTSLPSQARPHLVIVEGESERSVAWLKGFDMGRVSGSFSAVTIFPLVGGGVDQSQSYGRLKALLSRHSEEIQRIRQRYIGPLSAMQLERYLQLGFVQFSRTRDQPFDLIHASRAADDIPADIGSKINHVYQRFADTGLSDRDSAQFIASALIMDHYRTDMPLMDPQLVFQILYRPKTLQSESTGQSPPIVLLDLVDGAMSGEFARLRENRITSLDLRKQFLISRIGHYSSIKSNRLCLYCLLQPAQHFPSCDHPLCDQCARLFGTAAVDVEYQFTVERCLLCCNTVPMVINTLSPTMDPTVMAIDGGGVRGIIPIAHLILIQEYLRNDRHPEDIIRLQDLVDLFIGASSGGLIGVGLFPLDLPAAACAEVFNRLARRIFKQRRKPAFPWMSDWILGRARQWYSWLVHDSCYDGAVFDAVLQDLTGDRTLLHHHLHVTKSGAKLGLIATSVGTKTETVIFGNFNAVDMTQDCGYRLIRPAQIEHEPQLRHAAQATAAAPFMFPPVDIPAVGSFQDGGLTDNFAGGIARRVSRTIWPSSCEPARLLSLGTGSTENSGESNLPHFRHIFRDGFIRRAFNAWMTSLDAGRKWHEMKSQLDESIRPNFRRLDVTLNEPVAPLDNTSMMDHYRNLVLLHPNSARMAKDAAVDLLTARFYFELQTVPSVGHLPFWCHGTIRCKAPARSLVARLQDLVPHTLEFVTDSQRLGSLLPDRDICASCNRFCWPVSFLCRDPEQNIHIYLKAGRHGKWGVNPFPLTPVKLIQRQKMDLPFGQAHHGRPSHQPCSACDSGWTHFRDGRRRRDRSSSSPGPKRKRNRVGRSC